MIEKSVETKTTEQIIDEFYLTETLKGKEQWVRKQAYDAKEHECVCWKNNCESWQRKAREEFDLGNELCGKIKKLNQKYGELLQGEETNYDTAKVMFESLEKQELLTYSWGRIKLLKDILKELEVFGEGAFVCEKCKVPMKVVQVRDDGCRYFECPNCGATAGEETKE